MDKRLIKNSRPISLIDVDTKIISSCLALRVRTVIAKRIPSHQTAYVHGQYIGEPICLTDDMLEYTENKTIDSI